MAPRLVLFHYWRSSCSWRVRWALAHKGVAYESVPVNILAGEQRAEDYRARNPSGLLPCLEIDGVPYGESLALCEWIDETWPAPALLPAEPLHRLRARQLALCIATGTQPLQNPAALAHYHPEPAERAPHARYFISQGLATYERLLERSGLVGTYSCGEQVTLADLCLVPQVYNALRFDVDLSATPLVKRVYEACLEDAACERAAPHNQPGAVP